MRFNVGLLSKRFSRPYLIKYGRAFLCYSVASAVCL